MDKYYSLTKTLILSGIQCEKKLWFDLNDKIKLKDKAIFRSGNRFNDVVLKTLWRRLIKLKILRLYKYLFY